MAVADFSNPKVTQDYAGLLAAIRDLFASQAALHDGTGVVNSSPGAIRFNAANARFEKFDGTTWGPLLINVSGTAKNVTDVVLPINGGTGINNGAKTITLGGNLSFLGAYASTFTMTGVTTVVFPTSGKILSDAALVTVAQGGTQGVEEAPPLHLISADRLAHLQRIEAAFLAARISEEAAPAGAVPRLGETARG